MGGFGINSIIHEAEKMGEEVVKHPADILAGPFAPALAYIQSRGGVKGITHAIAGGSRPKNRAGLPPGHEAHPILPYLELAQEMGQPVPGAQPYSFAGYFKLAGGSAIVKDVGIADMLLKAQTPLFATDNQFPNPFQAYRLRWAVNAEPEDPANEDAGWIETVYCTFKAQTELARISLNALGLRTVLTSPPQGTSTGGACAFALEKQEGVYWPVFYEKNANYSMSPTSATAIASTSKAMSFGYQIDGWIIQDPSMLRMNEKSILEAVARLLS